MKIIKIIMMSASKIRKTGTKGHVLLIGAFTGIIVLLCTCEKLEVRREIKIKTQPVTDIASNSVVTVTGEIIDLDEDGIREYGHCWSTSENPSVKDAPRTKLGYRNTRGIFNDVLNGLVPFTKYYVRAYAIDANDTTYSNQTEFMKSIFQDSRDGHNYKWVSIGEQVWMAENLAYLPAVNPLALGSSYEPCYYVYDYNGNNVAEAKATVNYSTYGVLYNWPAAMQGAAGNDNNPSGVKGICPDGWHMPSDVEWKQLEIFLGMSPELANYGGWRGTNNEAGKLKEAGYVHWNGPNTGADNSSGFTALPGGWKEGEGEFYDIRNIGCFWSVTEYDYSSAFKRALSNEYEGIERENYYKDDAFSVRCIRDK